MTLLGFPACNAATIVVQERRRAAAACREVATAVTAVATVDTTANAEKAASDKAYRAADDPA
jgi:hypothetical protein